MAATDRRRTASTTLTRKEFARRLRTLAEMLDDGRAHTLTLAGKKVRLPSDATTDELLAHERSTPAKTMRFALEWRDESALTETITLRCTVVGHEP